MNSNANEKTKTKNPTNDIPDAASARAHGRLAMIEAAIDGELREKDETLFHGIQVMIEEVCADVHALSVMAKAKTSDVSIASDEDRRDALEAFDDAGAIKGGIIKPSPRPFRDLQTAVEDLGVAAMAAMRLVGEDDSDQGSPADALCGMLTRLRERFRCVELGLAEQRATRKAETAAAATAKANRLDLPHLLRELRELLVELDDSVYESCHDANQLDTILVTKNETFDEMAARNSFNRQSLLRNLLVTTMRVSELRGLINGYDTSASTEGRAA